MEHPLDSLQTSAYLLAADATLILHVLFAAFIVFGLIVIIVGKHYGWTWVRNPWFRLIHVAAIGVVTLQSWFGVICPLTILEKELRLQAGEAVYTGSFVSHYLGAILYYRAPMWVFAVCYTFFGLAVAASWLWVRPRPFTKSSTNSST